MVGTARRERRDRARRVRRAAGGTDPDAVGVLIGSGDPIQAAAAQILVLIGLPAAETIAVAVVLELVARGNLVRAPEPQRP
jgi:hypothetical protein